MEKDYTVSTINQANKETTCLQTCSIIVVQTIDVNTTNSISKLETENINENIKSSSSDHPHDSKEIEYVKTIPGTSIQNRATKTKLGHVKSDRERKSFVPWSNKSGIVSFMGKKHWGIWRYWIGMESVLTKKRREFWANFIDRRKGTLDICLPERWLT